MDYIDYREKLGIGFNDLDKQDLFKSRIQVFLQAHADISFSEEQETGFCYNIGVKSKLVNKSLVDVFENPDLKGLQRAWLYLKSEDDFCIFLSNIVTLGNTYFGLKKNKKLIQDSIKKALKDSHIPFEIIEDDDGIFFFPKGAKELDTALVADPLEWLKDYPNAHKTFCTALKQYSDGEYIRDTADNFRKALEEFLKEFLENTKNLSNNISEAFKYLGENNAEPELAGMMKSLLNAYDTLNNKIAKHNDKVDEKYLEFLMYQTGIFIRMMIVVKQSEK